MCIRDSLYNVCISFKMSIVSPQVDYIKTWINEKGDSLRHLAFQPNPRRHQGDSSGSSDEEEEEDLGELPPKETLQKLTRPGRVSVSAEAYGKFNVKRDYTPKIIQKSLEQKRRIKERLSQAFMFEALDEKDKQIVINAMEEKKFKPGDVIINQGDDGDNLYVVDTGELDCFRKFKKDGESTFVKKYGPGDAFGELALLYNAPRAATIKAVTPCILFALDRECFNHIVKDASAKKREKYENFLSKIEILESMDAYERAKIADALRPMKFKPQEYVVRQVNEHFDMKID
eukprot:TRINITY_DN1726_c0_g1_i1.p1 TRINITY_DN1726_c0_g1~~TRINITY_DN1726_c0_g1_i1.p1  ORF type:complete len:288 (+),score=96.16 TRINITY_DN1726_c0_g1_i1:1-864(+)